MKWFVVPIFLIQLTLFTDFSLCQLPVFSEIAIYKEGETVNVPCTVNNSADIPNVYWIHKNIKLTPSDHISINNSNVGYSTWTFTLTIKSIRQDDTGSYICRNGDQLVKDTDIQVYKLPTIFHNSSSVVQTFESSFADLDCYGDGYPALTITWTRANNQPLPDGSLAFQGNRLSLINVSREQRGEYICTAKINGFFKSSVNRSVTLNVHFAPAVYPVKRQLYHFAGENASLECTVYGQPTPKIVWTKEGKEVAESSVINVTSEQETRTQTSLEVENIESEDFGVYVCLAQNGLGKAEANVELTDGTHLITGRLG